MTPSILERHATDYEAFVGNRFTHFYCPILLKDQEGVELCDGHVIGRKFANSSRRIVIQRADVDRFYGSCFESRFYDFSRTRRMGIVEHLSDSTMSRRVPIKFERDGNVVPHYHFRGSCDPSHTLVRVQDGSGKVANVALKIAQDSHSLDGSNLQIVREDSFASEAIASVLKAAHLSMFALLGYRYVFSPAGYMLAKILGGCFEKFHAMSHSDVRGKVEEYFHPYKSISWPMYQYDANAIKGTIEDNSVLMCQGSSGRLFAIGVFARMEDLMSVVFLPSDDAETAGTYDDLVRGKLHSILCRPAKFRLAAGDGRWEVSSDTTVRLQYSDDASFWHSSY